MKKLITQMAVLVCCLFSIQMVNAQCSADVAWVDVAGPSIAPAPIAYCGEELGLTGADTLLVPFAVINSSIDGVPTAISYNVTSDLGISLVNPLDDGFFTYLAVTQADLDAAGAMFSITLEGVDNADCFFVVSANVADLGVTTVEEFCAPPPPIECADGEVAYTFNIIGSTSEYPNEMSWEIVDAAGTVLASAGCGEVVGDTVVELCLMEGETYTFNAYDDWGDGWNGGSYSIETGGSVIYSNTAVNNGTAGDDSDACDGDDLENAYSFVAGGAVAGCTDPTAFNYNPAATEDDGSCVYECAGDILWVDVTGPAISTSPIALCGADAGLTGADTIVIAYAILNSDFEVEYDITASTGVSLSSPLQDGFFTYLALSAADIAAAGDMVTITATGTSFGACELTADLMIADLDETVISSCLGTTECGAGEQLYTISVDGASSEYPNEMSWEFVDADGNVLASAGCGTITGNSSVDLCLTIGETYTFNAYDDWGDGWNGGGFTISTDGTVIYSNTTVNNGTAGDDSDACDGDDLETAYSFAAGGAVTGCTDPAAFNYNPAATEDDGSCVYECAGDILWVDASGPALSDFPIALCGADAGLTGDDTLVVAFAILNSDFEIIYDITSSAGVSLSTPLEDGFFTYLALTAADLTATDITLTATGTSFSDCVLTASFAVADLDAATVEACLGPIVDPCDGSDLAVSASVECDVDAEGNNTGTATLVITTSGGSGNVTVDTASETLNNGDTYSYTITATDELGCTATTTIEGTVDCPSCLDLFIGATLFACPGEAISVSGTDFNPDFTDPPSYDGLTAGAYFLEFYNADGCPLVIDLFIMDYVVFPAFEVQCIVDENGDNTGFAEVDITSVMDMNGIDVSGDVTVTYTPTEPIADGDSYVLDIQIEHNAFGCIYDFSFDGVVDCPVTVEPCEIVLGEMPQDQQVVCSSDQTSAQISDATLSADATAFYAIHTAIGADAPGDVLATNSTGTFSFADLTGGSYNQNYYLSFVASDDACGTLISEGPMVAWVAPIVIEANQDCEEQTGNSTFNVLYNITGGLPSYDANSSYSVSGDFNGSVEAGGNLIINYADNDPYFINVSDDLGCMGNAQGAFDPCSKQDVSLSDFGGRVEASGNYVFWSTASESENDYFILERSIDGSNFEAVAQIQGAGNSIVEIDYSYFDSKAPMGVCFYRLASVSTTGKVSYSNIIELNRENVTVVSISPVPTSSIANIAINVTEATMTYIEILDVSGKLVDMKTPMLEAGSNVIELNVNDLSAGVYFVKVTTNEQVNTVKMIKE